jgi:large subunit ribosomal protein L3
MSHGSKCHRLPGSIGSGTTPGRVWKGKQMAGRLGGKMATNKQVTIVQVILEKNLLLLNGSVPGKKGNFVMVKRAK